MIFVCGLCSCEGLVTFVGALLWNLDLFWPILFPTVSLLRVRLRVVKNVDGVLDSGRDVAVLELIAGCFFPKKSMIDLFVVILSKARKGSD